MHLRNLLTLALFSCSACVMAQPYPVITTIFSAMENAGFQGATAYEYYLSCETTFCVLKRTTYEMCFPDADLKREVMQVWIHEYSTNERTMEIAFPRNLTAQGSVSLKFGKIDSPADGGETSIKFDMKVGPAQPLVEVSNWAGFIEKTSLSSGKRTIKTLSPVTRPGQALKRNCPVILKSFLR